MAKKITSNSSNTGETEVWQQEAWPQMFLSANVVGKIPEHNAMTSLQYFYRFIGKILTKMPETLGGTVFKNKVKFVSKLVEFSNLIPWPEVRRLSYSFFRGVKTLETRWDSWDEIDEWFKSNMNKIIVKHMYPEFQ